MVLGFQRLNERTQRPNAFINFIKPLPGPDQELAQDFLERIAAICYPVMRAHHISVMALEEHVPNREFVGRNFNAGEVIQLCLKSLDGRWLSFRTVQLVMMHELAHCKQMNHSKAFWQVRDSYAEHLKVLWAQNYYGEGLWGKGQSLLSGRYTNDTNPEAAPNVQSLCGGAYRGRGGRRKKSGKDKPKLTYAERQQKRISRKFGKHGEGNVVGEDLYAKERLEKGRQTSAKPKVANSKRGRDLRAAAALARFDQAKTVVKEESSAGTVSTKEDSTDSETESEGEDDQSQLMDGNDNAVLDAKGHPLFKVCDSEDMKDEDARRELDELQDLNITPKARSANGSANTQTSSHDTGAMIKRSRKDDRDEPITITKKQKSSVQAQPSKATPIPTRKPPVSVNRAGGPQPCPVCSLENEPDAATCMACANVLDANKVNSAWRCSHQECRTSGYLNAGDAGVCGICGRAKT
ncbi:hypothetical protein MBLNU457_g3053t1 [Dothideomycetes sp. NU457]